MEKSIYVHKFGSDLVTNGQGVNAEALDRYVAGIKKTYEDYQIIIVTSGAVATGRYRASRTMSEEEIGGLTLPQLAAMGYSTVFKTWEDVCADHCIPAASSTVTHRQLDGLDSPDEKAVYDKFIERNGQTGLWTFINETDTLSVDELMKLYTGGENDGLASHTAIEYDAFALRLWKKKGGIFDNDKALISEVNSGNHAEVDAMAQNRMAGKNGRGGLPASIEACWRAAGAGVLASMAQPNEDMTGANITEFVVG